MRSFACAPSSLPFGLRNLISHEYFRVDLDVIQDIVSESLDQLELAARQLLDA